MLRTIVLFLLVTLITQRVASAEFRDIGPASRVTSGAFRRDCNYRVSFVGGFDDHHLFFVNSLLYQESGRPIHTGVPYGYYELRINVTVNDLLNLSDASIEGRPVPVVFYDPELIVRIPIGVANSVLVFGQFRKEQESWHTQMFLDPSRIRIQRDCPAFSR